MTLYNYFQRSEGLPDPRGNLSLSISSSAITSANSEVSRALQESRCSRTKKKGTYSKYDPELRAQIGRYAVINGTSAAARYFTRKLGEPVSRSTVQSIKKSYELARKQSRSSVPIKELTRKPCGRPLLLGHKLDSMVQAYIRRVREGGGVVNTRIAAAAARGIVMKYERERLIEFGGHVQLRRTWAESLLERMNFVRRKATTAKSKQSLEVFEQLKNGFLSNVSAAVVMEEIKPELVYNWDQTGVNLVPNSSWTHEVKGAQRVEIAGLGDKRQITAVLCESLIGDFLLVQLVYKGTTDRVHPTFTFPKEWHITHSKKHWSNEHTMLQYVSEVFLPHVEQTRALIKDTTVTALLIMDNFKGQVTTPINNLLEENNVHVCLLPANTTDRLQPMDISVNKPFKAYLQRKFVEWYSVQLMQQLSDQDDDNMSTSVPSVDLSLTKLKEVSATWFVEAANYIADNPSFIVNGFRHSGIIAAIDRAYGYTGNTDNSDVADTENIEDDDYSTDNGSEIDSDAYSDTNSDSDSSDTDSYNSNSDSESDSDCQIISD